MINDRGSLLLETVIGIGIAAIMILVPLQFVVSSAHGVHSTAEADVGMQVGREVMTDFRSYSPGDPRRQAGVSEFTFDKYGSPLGGARSQLPTTEQAKVYYEVRATVAADSSQVGFGGGTAPVTMELRTLNIQVTTIQALNGGAPKPLILETVLPAK